MKRKFNLSFSTRLYLWATLLILITFSGIAAIFHTYSSQRE